MDNYLQTVEEVYAEAARQPDAELCCTQSPVWRLPDLEIPPAMLAMNYGCGSTVSPRDLRGDDTILYVGVGGGLEALQFAYFTRRPGSVLAVDPVAAMRDRAHANLEEAARLNRWFRPDFVTLLDGSAFALPAADNSVSIAAQNCLFNVFATGDLERALGEVVRVLKIGGLFSTSDPISPVPLPPSLAENARLRARCISGCLTYEQYVEALTRSGFGRVEIRGRFPYRYLHPRDYPELATAPHPTLSPRGRGLGEGVMLESLEAAAFKVPDGLDGPEVFTGRTATYAGPEPSFRDAHGNSLRRGMPTFISDAAARRLGQRSDIVLTSPTWHYKGGGCC